MRKAYYTYAISFLLVTVLNMTGILQAQPADTIITATKTVTEAAPVSPEKMFTNITGALLEDQQYSNLYLNQKTSFHISIDARLFPVPGGESRVALFKLPDYTDDYILVIKSKVHGIGLKWHMFAPSVVFLDSLLRPVHFLGERNFTIVPPSSYQVIHLQSQVIIDKARENCRYVLVYTQNKNERLGTYNDYSQGVLPSFINHPIERSPDARLQLELHLR